MAISRKSPNVVNDTTPQLGGSLDVNGNSIVSASNGDIAITPNGTGDVVLDGLKYPQADGTAGYVLKTDGSAQLSWVAQTTDTDTTYTSSDFTHDSLSGVTANEHLDWTADQGTTNVHSGNYTDTDTVYTHPNHSGDVTSTADGATVISAGAVDIAMLSATGTAGATNFLRGDNTWVVPTDTNTTYTSSDFTHDDLTGFVANEHIDWTTDQGTTNVHSGNYTDTDTDTTYTAGDGLALASEEFTLDLTKDQSWTGSQRGTPSVVTDGTLDLNTANNFKYTPAASPDTLEFTNETAGQSGFITVINASGHTIATGSEVKKSSTWDISTAGTYLVSYYSDGTNVYLSASAALAT